MVFEESRGNDHVPGGTLAVALCAIFGMPATDYQHLF